MRTAARGFSISRVQLGHKCIGRYKGHRRYQRRRTAVVAGSAVEAGSAGPAVGAAFPARSGLRRAPDCGEDRRDKRGSGEKAEGGGGRDAPRPRPAPALKRNKAPTPRRRQGDWHGRNAQGGRPGQGYLRGGRGARHRLPPRQSRAAVRRGRSLPAARLRPRAGPGSREATRGQREEMAEGRGPLSAGPLGQCGGARDRARLRRRQVAGGRGLELKLRPRARWYCCEEDLSSL